MKVKKNKIIIKNASLKDGVLSFSLEGKDEKQFKVSNIKKFSINKTKTPLSYYLTIPLILIAGFFIDKKIFFLLIPTLAYLGYLKFYHRHYKLILIEHSGTKYKFTFYKKLRSVLFDIRLKVKYMLLTN
jgi:hypothetical protein